jgi:hypothetical protein
MLEVLHGLMPVFLVADCTLNRASLRWLGVDFSEGHCHRKAEKLFVILFLLQDRKTEIEGERCRSEGGDVDPDAESHRDSVSLEIDGVFHGARIDEEDTAE